MLPNYKSAIKLAEEMSELTKELCKTLQYTDNRQITIQDELGDVLAAIEIYLQTHPSISRDCVEKRKKYKINRYKEFNLNE